MSYYTRSYSGGAELFESHDTAQENGDNDDLILVPQSPHLIYSVGRFHDFHDDDKEDYNSEGHDPSTIHLGHGGDAGISQGPGPGSDPGQGQSSSQCDTNMESQDRRSYLPYPYGFMPRDEGVDHSATPYSSDFMQHEYGKRRINDASTYQAWPSRPSSPSISSNQNDQDLLGIEVLIESTGSHLILQRDEGTVPNPLAERICPVCRTVFTGNCAQRNLTRHVAQFHGSEERVHSCLGCGKVYKRGDALKKHQRVKQCGQLTSVATRRG